MPVKLTPADLPWIERGGGARSVRLVGRVQGADGLLNGLTEIPPGAAIPMHYHDVEESVLVMQGEGLADVDGETIAVRAGDVTWLPPGVPHRFRAPEGGPGLTIFWTYASAAATRTLVETGETRPVDAEHDGA